MISVVTSVRNNSEEASECLASFVRTFAKFQTPVEYILIDDNSDPAQNVPALFEKFRRDVGTGNAASKVISVLFRQQQHYTRALAYGFSMAMGEHVLFISHDMQLTPDYLQTVLAVAATSESIGLVRGTAPFVDCFPEHQISPPTPLQTAEELDAFAKSVADSHGMTATEDRFLTGDAMLIKREVFDKIGVFDPRYFGYFGDIDFGLRVRRAGFKMVCARGAWLWHEGQGAYKDQARVTGTDYKVIHRRRMEVVSAAYRVFRAKWDRTLPEEYCGVKVIDFDKLTAGLPPQGGDFQPNLQPNPATCTIQV